MTFLNKIYLTAALIVIFSASLFALKHHYDSQLIHYGEMKQALKSLQVKDSAQTKHITALGDTLEKALKNTRQAITRWDTITKRDTIRLPGQVDRVVFHDTLFAQLPDSVKVDSLVARGDRLQLQCTALANRCQMFRDSAYSVFRTKDSIINVTKEMFKTTPRRKCGVGGAVGPSAGFASVRPDTSSKRTWRPAWGVFGTLGIACNL